jgi:hypothetical protein
MSKLKMVILLVFVALFVVVTVSATNGVSIRRNDTTLTVTLDKDYKSASGDICIYLEKPGTDPLYKTTDWFSFALNRNKRTDTYTARNGLIITSYNDSACNAIPE